MSSDSSASSTHLEASQRGRVSRRYVWASKRDWANAVNCACKLVLAPAHHPYNLATRRLGCCPWCRENPGLDFMSDAGNVTARAGSAVSLLHVKFVSRFLMFLVLSRACPCVLLSSRCHSSFTYLPHSAYRISWEVPSCAASRGCRKGACPAIDLVCWSSSAWVPLPPPPSPPFCTMIWFASLRAITCGRLHISDGTGAVAIAIFFVWLEVINKHFGSHLPSWTHTLPVV